MYYVRILYSGFLEGLSTNFMKKLSTANITKPTTELSMSSNSASSGFFEL